MNPQPDGSSSSDLSPFVGEVGRCLLSSTMLGSSAGVRATCEHFATSSGKVVQPQSVKRVGVALGPDVTRMFTKLCRKSVNQGEASSSTQVDNQVDEPEVVDATILARDVRFENERFIELALAHPKLLAAKLHAQRDQNNKLERKLREKTAQLPVSQIQRISSTAKQQGAHVHGNHRQHQTPSTTSSSRKFSMARAPPHTNSNSQNNEQATTAKTTFRERKPKLKTTKKPQQPPARTQQQKPGQTTNLLQPKPATPSFHNKHTPTHATPTNRSLPSRRPERTMARWKHPKDSEYDSDSTMASELKYTTDGSDHVEFLLAKARDAIAEALLISKPDLPKRAPQIDVGNTQTALKRMISALEAQLNISTDTPNRSIDG